MTREFKLTLLTAIFVAGFIGANILGIKIIPFLGLSVSVGVFFYPLTFLITDATSEVFGKKKAQQIVWSALIAQILVLFLILIAIKLPAADRFTLDTEYGNIFSNSLRMIIASLTAFTISQLHDIWAFDFWKRKTKGKFLWLRNNASTVTSQALDTLIFMYGAFYMMTPKFTVSYVFGLAVSYWLFKLAFAVVDTPFVYLLVRWLKKSK